MKQAHVADDVDEAGTATPNQADKGDPADQAPAALESQPMAVRIAQLAAETKALDVRVMRVRELVQYTDFFVLASGRSDRQVAAIREHIQDQVRVELGRKPLSVEGTERNQWAVIDYGDIVVHVFFEPVREFYQLEALWGDAPVLEVDLPAGDALN